MAVMRKRLTLTGSTLRPRRSRRRARSRAALHEHVWPLLEDGRVRPVILADVPARAGRRGPPAMESSRHIGKIVLTV